MRDRKCRNNEEQKPINALRRSARFLHKNQAGGESPGTPVPARRKIGAPDFFSTSIGSSFAKNQKDGDGVSQKAKRKGSESKSLREPIEGSRRSARLDSRANLCSPDLQKQCVMEKAMRRSLVCGLKSANCQLHKCDRVSKNGDKKVTGLESSAKPGKGSKRSGRLDGRANVNKAEEVLHLQKEYVTERRVTRSSVRGNKFVYNQGNESGSAKDSEEGVRILSKEGKAKVGAGSCKQSPENIEKRFTRSSSQIKVIQQVEEAGNVSPECRQINKNCERKMHICEKRKRYQVEEECEIVQGWTKEQELALQRAYFTAKPTPHFWKKVAKMVPGKSAEECFDRIQSDLLTPSQPRTRSRAKKNLSPLSFSASKLLSPAEMKTKRLRSTRRKTLLAQKTVRELLQKQQNENQDHEADLFAVLEPTMDSSSLNFQAATLFTSPVPNKGSGVLTRCRETLRLNSSQKAAFASPPVLKQIKNKALHEKYIDQLHCRDAKRKAESLRNAKCIQDKKSTDLKVNSVKVAKDALVLDAQDAIHQLRSLQASTNDNLDDDDNISHSNEDEDEDEDDLC
ncbi:UNVERIFIED_CONTAM: hypothetical protein Sangu_0771500 [Sesamum angustifolium]|uniref:Myb-like domain-containing protein n=1 Tax=Sesamum angustifolium TaxID=2727405 RepID=A0AAW2PU19_9LAMI